MQKEKDVSRKNIAFHIVHGFVLAMLAVIIAGFFLAVASTPNFRQPVAEMVHIPQGWDIHLQNATQDWDEPFQTWLSADTLDMNDIQFFADNNYRQIYYRIDIIGYHEATIVFSFDNRPANVNCATGEIATSKGGSLSLFGAQIYEGSGSEDCVFSNLFENLLGTVQSAIYDAALFSPGDGFCLSYNALEMQSYLNQVDEAYPEDEFALTINVDSNGLRSTCVMSEENLGTRYQIYDRDAEAVSALQTVELEQGLSLTEAFIELLNARGLAPE